MHYEELCEFSMEIIANAGMAKSLSYEAIEFAKYGDFEKANNKMKELENYLLTAHDIQTNLITKEASLKDKIEVNLLLIHSQDHLTMAQMAKDNAKILIDIYERLGK